MAVAYAALQRALAAKGRPAPIEGLTPEQRFYLSWARIWRTQYRPEAMRTLIATNSHAPPRWRVNGPLSNQPEFAKAFGCKAGAPMVRSEDLSTEIW